MSDDVGVAIGADEAAQLPNSIDSIFSWINARIGDSGLVAATFDATDGHPVDIYVDAILEGDDDEQTYRVHDLTVLD